jgi:predicted GTPase
MMSYMDEQSSSLPLDLWHHIIGYVLTCNTLAKLERVSKTLKSVTDTYWKILWEIENPNTKLSKNYRFACQQTHTKDFTYKYDQFCMYSKGPNINVLVMGNKAVGKSSLRHRICFNTFVDEVDETMYANIQLVTF